MRRPCGRRITATIVVVGNLRPLRRHAARLIAIAALGFATEAHADQVVVLDQTWTHSPDLPDSHFRVAPQAGTPQDWTSPVDYTGGSVWVYLEVQTKPTAQETKFQVCFEATPTYACTYQSPTYTEIGTYEWETPFDGFWSPPGEYVDWTQGVNQIACILKDTMNGKPSADNVGDEVAALYTPTDVRMVVTVVEAGGIYEPPTPTGAGGSSSGGSEGGGADSGGTESSAGSSGGPVGSEGGAGSSDGGGETTAAATTSGGSGSDSSGAAMATSDGDTSGCSCRSDGGTPAPAAALLGLLAWLRRRRRH